MDPALWNLEVYQDRVKALWTLLHSDPHVPLAIPLGLLLGFVSTLLFFPLLQRLTPLLMRWKRLHHTPVSDIPGIPEHYDYAFISALCTLPDPHNFVGAYSSALADTEMVMEEDGSFEVVISQERPPGCKNWLAAQGIQDGLLVFRRYGVPEGVRVDYPELRQLDNNATLKPAYSTTCGAMTTERTHLHRYHRVMMVIQLKVVVYISLLLAGWSALATNAVVAVSSMVVVAVNHLLYLAGRRKASRMLLDKIKDRVHEAIEPAALEYGNKGARPHPGHKYYVFVYDTRRGGDVLIRGTILKGRQKFWTLVLYNPEGIPLPQYYNDRTIIPAHETDKQMDYEVVLTQGDVQVPRCAGGNSISVASSPWGVGLVRIIFPEDEEVFPISKPSIQVVQTSHKKTV